MLADRKILAVVPARSGSRGIPGKNMRKVGGLSLIARAAHTLSRAAFVDVSMLSTDSAEYAIEGEKYGLRVPCLRPAELSDDRASSIATLQHALRECERVFETRFDIILVVEPTSPLRVPEDLERATRRLVESGADSVVTVSSLPPWAHPFKILTVREGNLQYFREEGRCSWRRQDLSGQYYWRNGICYALSRACLTVYQAILTDRSVPLIIDRPVVNVDEPMDLMWAESLLRAGTDRRADGEGLVP